MSFLSGIFTAISQVFGWISGRSAVNNAPDMKAAAIAQKQKDQDDLDAKRIKDADIDSIRRD